MPISDLTGTTWTINSTTCTAGYGRFFINYICPYDVTEQSELAIGYYYNPKTDAWVSSSDTITTFGGFHNIAVNDVISITGGTDATNATLIAWLEANATQQVAPQPSASISIGNLPIDKAYFGNSEISKMWLGNNKIYEKGTAPSGYDVVFNAYGAFNSSNDGQIQIYDGQDSTGTLLLNQQPANQSAFPMTLHFDSGYCYVLIKGPSLSSPDIYSDDFSIWGYGGGMSYYDSCTIDKNGTINISVADFDE